MKLAPRNNQKTTGLKPHTLHLRHHALLCKEMIELERTRIISSLMSNYASSVVVTVSALQHPLHSKYFCKILYPQKKDPVTN